ncbi:hypothetical protein BU26DRAFT_168971 [Trematosphaeria pertusa]|uniref:Uncharacterized protein n=1 Tax=Trematosphaeria pertusa TaxID=390896 RepID=A0A6A6HUK7_9PLEO|nr:uncharacterized protein BU26DRAFT_168971 [Trematosphaeria pertusa]KAF2241707.1 hypothetical protein BU26DRAFT_168971 [Trematosphaeria pertusa]
MARRYNKSDLEGAERPTSGPLPLAGLIRLQSGRSRKGNKLWRPLQPSDLGGSERNDAGDFDVDSSFSPIDISEPLTNTDAARPLPAHRFRGGGSPYDLAPLQTDTSMKTARQHNEALNQSTEETPVSETMDSEDISPTDMSFGVMENYTRVFGKLPDHIRLQEETGDFDGQVVFIGHPNRDVYAHQWSSASFQWVSVGNWSHAHRRVEGLLAGQRLPGTRLPYNSIEYFKLAAENQEKLIKEFGRPEEDPAPTRPTFTEADRMASLSSASESPDNQFPTLARTTAAHATPEEGSTTTSATRNVTREHLEDPFVTPARPPQPAIPTSLKFGSGGPGAIGSMNFSYEFPVRPRATSGPFHHQSPELNPQQAYIQRERERLEAIRRGGELRETPTHLREVDFGEEASSAFATPAVRGTSIRTRASLSPEDVHNRQQLKNRLAGLGGQADRPALPADRRVPVPDVQTNIRALFPPGPTVANPYRRVSTLNANAVPYTCASIAAQVSEASVSEVTTVTAGPAPNLHVSDPDGLRQARAQEVANGLGQQAPTRQNFNGPFFSESMPTAYDPTVSLTIQVNNDEKLSTWFRDGQRPLRQQEYAKTLMGTTNKTKTFGAVGDGSSRMQNSTKYENTPFFVRAYENLFEYAEESRAGGSSSYFTRAWKPASLHLRDLSPNGNNSFFSDVSHASPQLRREANRAVPTFSGSPWGGGIGLSADSPFHFFEELVVPDDDSSHRPRRDF